MNREALLARIQGDGPLADVLADVLKVMGKYDLTHFDAMLVAAFLMGSVTVDLPDMGSLSEELGALLTDATDIGRETYALLMEREMAVEEAERMLHD